jgi:hypothetical protein
MKIKYDLIRTTRSAFKLLTNLIMATSMASCLTPLDRSEDYIGGQYVIHGQISPLEETNIVFVGRTSSRERRPEVETEAEVTLIDDEGNEYHYQYSPELERYILPGIQGIPGRTYFVRIAFSGGRTYESIPEKMPLALGIDEVYHTIAPEEYTDEDGIVAERDFVQIYSNHTLPSTDQPVFLKWHVEEVYAIAPTDFPDPFGNVPPSCYVAQQVDPQNIVLFSNEATAVSLLPDLHIVSRLVDMSFKERHYFTTYQSSLTREAFDYWTKVDILANQVGSIFDTPPARLAGNIFNTRDHSEEVHGYFQAVNQNYHRFYMLPVDLPYKLTIHCEYRPERDYYDYPSQCLNCTSVNNSSYIRPPWF